MIETLRPTQEDRRKIQSVIDAVAKPLSQYHDVFVGGSIAKDTWLRNARDIDLFIRFREGNDLSERVEKTLKRCGFTFERVHGSRDYFQITMDEYIVEIIPIKSIDRADQASNITDVSPLHVAWVQQYSQHTDEIRLAKAFAKAQHFYGAESYIQGLSGYCLEILTIHYKGFENLLKAASQWGKQTIIDVEGYHHDPLHAINESKISPLILIDPVDPTRNAAASLNQEKYELFKRKAAQYLKNPTHDWFTKERITKELARKKDGTVAFVTIRPVEGKKDVVGCKIRRVYQYILKQLMFHEFTVTDSDWEFEGNARMYFTIPHTQRSPTVIKTGPPIKATVDAEKFRKKHPDAFEQDKRLYATVKRSYNTPKELFEDIKKDPVVTERVKDIQIDYL
ncbi:MAG: nucleotidyltransferase domain-containing protein [Nanobdellota archaeon]